MTTDPDATAPRPTRTAGDYTLIRRLGAGGFGTVFEARHRESDLPYALKRMQLSEEDADRFRKEALYPARVASQSMHVVSVHSFFRDQAEGFCYLVTELIPHGDLRRFLDEHPKPLPLDQALDIALGIARGLTAIHEQSIVHRDLKPGNVLMDRKDGLWIPKIGDFGLARSSDSVSVGDFASPGYAAPEQLDLMDTAGPGPESDLFSFGMLLYELLTGERPATTGDLREYGRWVRERLPLPPPSQRRPELQRWPELDALVDSLLEPDRARRARSAEPVVRTLARVRRLVEEPPAPVPVVVARPAAETPPAVIPPRPGWRRLAPWAAGFAASGALLGLLFAVTAGEPVTLASVLFGLVLALVALDRWLPRTLLVLATPVVFNVVLVVRPRLELAANALFREEAVYSEVCAAAFVGGLGAVLMTLTLAIWRREFLWAIPRAALAGVAGTVLFIALIVAPKVFAAASGVVPVLSLPFAFWQTAVGCALAAYAFSGPAASAAGPDTRRRSFAVLLALLVVAVGAGGYGEWRQGHPAALSAGRDATNAKDGLQYRWIPPGEFRQGCSSGDPDCYGNESPPHDVKFTKGFWLADTEVTVAAWRNVMPALPPELTWMGANLNPGWANVEMPIANVTWSEARTYCAAIDGRLPTEAEWEYATRAGTTEATYGRLDAIARYADNSGRERLEALSLPADGYDRRLAGNGNGMREVGRLSPNAWRLRDMLGNVAEWVEDDYAERAYQVFTPRDRVDPQAHMTGTPIALKVTRGGSWFQSAKGVRASFRLPARGDQRLVDVGFRCVWNKAP